jgi:hypothetical protein
VQHVTRLLWLGIGNALMWIALTAWPVFAQSTPVTDRLDDRIRQTEVTLSGVNVRLDVLSEGVRDIRVRMDTMLKSLLGGFVTIIGALIATLWSIRQGWIVTAPKGGP